MISLSLLVYVSVAIVAEMCRILRKEGRETWAEAWGGVISKLMSLAIEGVMQRKPVKNKEQDLTR